MEVIKLNHQHVSAFRQLLGIYKTVFENEEPIAENDQLSALLAKPDFMVFVVRQHDIVVGGLTIYILHRYFGAKPVAYIYDVGVSPAFQNKGAGRALITAVCKYCKENGFEYAYVEAESEDTGAVNFYRKTACSSELNAIHFTYLFEDIK